MDVQRAIAILLPNDADLLATLDAFRAVQDSVSEAAFNDGKPLDADPSVSAEARKASVSPPVLSEGKPTTFRRG